MRYDPVTGLPSLEDGLALAFEMGMLEGRKRLGETLSEADEARLNEIKELLAEADVRANQPTPSQQAARARRQRKIRRQQAAYMRADPRLRMQRFNATMQRDAQRRQAVERRETRHQAVLAPEPVTSASRPRERKPASRARARGPDGDREPPLCAGCEKPLDPRRPNHKHHNGACRERARRNRQKQDAILLRYRDAIYKARRGGELTEDDALELLVAPSQRVLAMLEAAA